MSNISWNLDQLKKTLSSRKEVKAWIISQENVRRRERYFMLDGGTLITDQDRDVSSQAIQAKIIVYLSKEGRQG